MTTCAYMVQTYRSTRSPGKSDQWWTSCSIGVLTRRVKRGQALDQNRPRNGTARGTGDQSEEDIHSLMLEGQGSEL